ncbi:son of sevenless homolog 2-like [Diadema setosum]|uniref:son of sevenless homolog 2-like n=1 Tax=Diadema setosum TaxID=31175 RepID=UPI003B3A2EE9
MATVDFESEDYKKWRGLFVNALRKVQQQVHANLQADEDSLEYIESLIICLLNMLCAGQPHSVHDVEDRVKKTFPNPIDQWAINDARSALEKGRKKAPLVLPVDKIHQLLREVLGYRVDYQVSLYLVAVLEYIAADILKLAGNYVKNICHTNISLQDIKVAMCADKVLMEMFYQDEDDAAAMSSLSVEDELQDSRTGTLTYDEVVKDLIMEETQYLRDLNLIIKVFRNFFVDAPQYFTQEDVNAIFGNILDIHQLTVSFLGLLEDAMEMMDDSDSNSFVGIGECFEEMAEAEEFGVYSRYAEQILSDECRGAIRRLVAQPEVSEYLQEHNIQDAVTYVLPKLLLEPIYHCIHYFDSLKLLLKTSPNEEERDRFKQASGLLKKIQAALERVCAGHLPKRKAGESSLRFHRRLASRQMCIKRMNEIQKNIEGWEGRDISQLCNEFIMGGTVGKVHTGKNKKQNTERHIFLFDSMIVCCKLNTRRSVSSSSPEYRFKERYNLRKVNVVDRQDAEDVKHAYEIVVKDPPQTIIFFAKNAEDKTNWMEALTTLLHRSTLERMLDSILQKEEENQPLRLPSAEDYCFVEEDSPDNIVFEEGQKSIGGVPLIKGGTLLKLIERLTYHKYADPSFVRTFLTTYRSFCKPQDLLSLLIKRFEIPDPPPTEEDQAALDRGVSVVREDLKRFRKEYAQPIQLRVLNVFRHWVDQHFYDFDRDEQLLMRLEKFIEESVRGKGMRKWVESIKKIITRRWESEEQRHILTFERDPPPVEHHIAKTPDEFDLMTLHPIEIARQLTLLESDLYRAVKPSELVGSVWTKKDKNITSPNLLKMIHHSNMFILWLEKCIVETSNLEERIAVVSRIVEIMMVFQEYNNFNGVLEIVSAINSSAIHRLEHTFRDLRKKQALEEAKELGTDHYKKYQEKLRSINPPCVPFLGMYLTNILFIEQGNPDFLANCSEGLINFSKRRRVAEITGEIQQYQHQPYCLSQEQDIRKFFEELNPLAEMTEKEFQDYLYKTSLEIEPRNCKQLPKYPKKYEYSLKSPGIKPSSSRHMSLVGTSRLTSDLRSPSFQRMHDEEATSPKATCATPPSPRTPTITSTQSIFDSSVFSSVDLGSNSNTPSFTQEEPAEPPPPPRPPRSRLSSTPNPHEPPSLPPKNTGPPIPPRNSQNLNGGIPLVPPRTYRNPNSLGRNSSLQRKVSGSLPGPLTGVSSVAAPSIPRREPPPPIPPSSDNPWVPRTPQHLQHNHAFLLSQTGHVPSFPANNADHHHLHHHHHQQQQHQHQQHQHHPQLGFTQTLMPPPRRRIKEKREEPVRPPRTPPRDMQLSPEELKFFESSY